MGWSKGQAKEFARRVTRRRDWDSSLLTDEVRGALVAETVLGIVISQVKEAVGVEDVRRLLVEVRRAAKLENDEEGGRG